MNFLLFVGACVGHVALLVFLLSRWYALPLPRMMLRGFRALVAVAIAGGPLWLLAVYGLDVVHAWRSGPALAVYLSMCWIIGLGIVPGQTIIRLLRRRPQALLNNHTRTLNVAHELG